MKFHIFVIKSQDSYIWASPREKSKEKGQRKKKKL